MIKTKDLEEYIKKHLPDCYGVYKEYDQEIIKRLRERDELKKELDELKSGK